VCVCVCVLCVCVCGVCVCVDEYSTKSLSVVILHGKDTRALTFENDVKVYIHTNITYIRSILYIYIYI
jgi:hypothetical protein